VAHKHVLVWAAAMVLLIAPAAAQTSATTKPAATKIVVTLLGTSPGPPVNPRRYQASTLVVAGDEVLLFDCGRGATVRLVQAGMRPERVSKVFLTHLHSDHIAQLPDLYMSFWPLVPRKSSGPRLVPLEVWGPTGTRDMMDHLQQAFAFDTHIRRDVDERFPGEGAKVVSHDISEGTVYEHNGVKVTAFLVDHGPVKPAFGYRVDYAGHSVALSGDTRPSENLVRFSKGVDVIIHEALDADIFSDLVVDTAEAHRQREQIAAHHTSPEQAGELFNRLKPKLAVFSHVTSSPNIMPRARKTYSGPLEFGEDLMRIEIGDKVSVRRHTAPADGAK
jgi:ribonuclease Z